MPKNEPFAVSRECYAMAIKNAGKSGEITLYGRVVDKRPTDWFGNAIKGDFIVQSEFIEDLSNLKDCAELNVSLNSVGGLVSAGITIHNKLREMASKGVKINCTVDGVAMSAGSLIMCAADTVKAYPTSLIMIHKSSMTMEDSLNADGLRKAAESLDAYDKAIISAYKRKTGKGEQELAEMMSAETYMTGEEAKEKGFVDEVLEGGKTQISASADGSSLIVNGHVLPLGGLKCPNNLPVIADLSQIIDNASTEPAVKPAGVEDTNNPEGGTTMADTTITPAPAQPSASASEEQIKAAVLAERERLQKIDTIAAQFGADIVADAKYKNPCTAEELAYRAAVESAKKGASFLKNAEEDANNSGAANVGAAPAPADKPTNELTDDEKMAKARAEVKALFGGDDE